jgi:hypothetical protein
MHSFSLYVMVTDSVKKEAVVGVMLLITIKMIDIKLLQRSRVRTMLFA